MPKLSKKTKNCLLKTIKMYSELLTNQEYIVLNKLCIEYGKCRGRFFNDLCGINSLELVDNAKKLRNDIRKYGIDKQLIKTYSFLSRHWVEALFDTCTNVKSMWSNTANKIRKVIQGNDNIDENERHYLYFVLCFPHLWLGVLTHKDNYYRDLAKKYQTPYLEIIKILTDKQLKHANNYLRRLTRRYKAYPHKISQNNKSMTYDQNMYRIFKKSNNPMISFASNEAGKRIKKKLTGPWRYANKGNIQIILDRDKKRVEIHKCIKTHKQKFSGAQTIGIDKGLHNLISCSTDNEYGCNFSYFANKESDRLCEKNRRRNQARINRHELGGKHYRKTRDQHRAYMQAVINHAIYQMLFNEKPKKIVKEDLKFTKEKLSKKVNNYLAKQRRRLNSWTKGYLDDRLNYICDKYQVKHQDINPAYTSQYCPTCGHKFLFRKGKHHEWSYCENCGWVNANTSAAKNIKNRENDPDITLYTPYKKVKEILDSRI